MTQAYKCDRCGSYVDETFVQIRYYAPEGNNDRADLCGACEATLERFMGGCEVE